MPKIVLCESCGREKEHYAKGLCSTCYKHQQHYSEGKRCDCGKLVTNGSKRCRSCANRLRSNGRKGGNNPHWQGGIIERAGRIHIHAPDNPMSDGQGYVRRSRLVLAEKLGRTLRPEEIVHHINLDTKDDSPSNLKLFANHSEHTKRHHKMKKIDKLREWLSSKEYMPAPT